MKRPRQAKTPEQMEREKKGGGGPREGQRKKSEVLQLIGKKRTFTTTREADLNSAGWDFGNTGIARNDDGS